MLIAADFDGTIAQTFVPSPNNIGIYQAYRLACGNVFGREGARLYDEIGGINSSAPIELVKALLEAGSQKILIRNAKAFLNRKREHLRGFVPEGKGASLEWNQEDPLLVVTETLVREKMRWFWDEIGAHFADGRIWPQPCTGFLEFYRTLLVCAGSYCSGDVHLALGIVSSGHDYFIRRCFEAWGFPCPDLLVTDDLMRSPRCSHFLLEEKVKPGVGPFQMMRTEWQQRFGNELREGAALYVGDSLKTDGAFALNIGLPFVWFNPEGQNQPSSVGGDVVPISDWRELTPFLHSSVVARVQKGLPLSLVVHEVLGR